MHYLNRTIFGGVLIGLAVLFGIFFLWPKYHELSAMQQRVVNKRTELENRQEYIANLRIAEQKLRRYEPQLRIVRDAIPQHLDLPELFHLIDRLRADAGLILKAISAGETQEAFAGTQVKATSVTAEFVGSYSSMKRFVSDLRKSARLLELESVLFEAGAPEAGGDQFTSTIVFRAYSY
jgi:Tfp pilus assembly protein PilO